MTAYKCCSLDETVQHVAVNGGDGYSYGYGFHIRSGNRPVVHFAFATQKTPDGREPRSRRTRKSDRAHAAS